MIRVRVRERRRAVTRKETLRPISFVYLYTHRFLGTTLAFLPAAPLLVAVSCLLRDGTAAPETIFCPSPATTLVSAFRGLLALLGAIENEGRETGRTIDTELLLIQYAWCNETTDVLPCDNVHPKRRSFTSRR